MFLLASMFVSAIPVDVEVPETVNCVCSYINYSEYVDSRPQQFLVDCENKGSVSCRLRLRADVYRMDGLTSIQWSEEKPLEPGDHSDFRLFFYPNISGEYVVNFSAYYCNVIGYVGKALFNADVSENLSILSEQGRNVSKKSVEVVTSNNLNKVFFKIKSSSEVRDLVIVPAKYPLGWVVESKKIDHVPAGGEVVAELSYVPTIWKPVELVYYVASMDGSVYDVEVVLLREEKTGYPLHYYMLGFLSVLVVVLTVLLLRERCRRNLN